MESIQLKYPSLPRCLPYHDNSELKDREGTEEH